MNKTGLHRKIYAVFGFLGAAYKFYIITEIFGYKNIVNAEIGNASYGYIFDFYSAAPSQRSQYRQLIRRIYTLNVKRRIGFGKAGFLRAF